MEFDPNEIYDEPTPNPPSDFEWKVGARDDEVTITKFLNETATVCVVPEKIDGRAVTEIGESAFE